MIRNCADHLRARAGSGREYFLPLNCGKSVGAQQLHEVLRRRAEELPQIVVWAKPVNDEVFPGAQSDALAIKLPLVEHLDLPGNGGRDGLAGESSCKGQHPRLLMMTGD